MIGPVGGWHSLLLRELWAYRALLTIKDTKKRYRQTVLGAAHAGASLSA
jgi:hypothetical protein